MSHPAVPGYEDFAAIGHPSVKVVFLCPDVRSHVLGAVARQIRAVSGSPPGSGYFVDIGGLTKVVAPDGTAKLKGQCRLCSQNGTRQVSTPNLRWEKVEKLLDHAQETETGVFRCQMRF